MMPFELVMPLYLPSDDFQDRMSGKCKLPLRPCLNTRTVPQFSFHPPRQQEHSKAKKQVSFADHKGLALTVVKIFSEFDKPVDVPLSIHQLFASALDISEVEDKLALDFVQPTTDYVHFRQRLERDSVCLEHCVLKDRTIVGMIKVKNLAYKKVVKVRITFDTWKSHADFDCQYVKDTYLDSGWDIFSFEVNLPARVELHERIEFAVSYMADGNMYWDNNQGQNYKITHTALKNTSVSDTSSGQQHCRDQDFYFDQFGSPKCTHGIYPELPSYAGYEDLGPYY